MRIYYRRGGKGAAPEGFDRVYTEVDGSGSILRELLAYVRAGDSVTVEMVGELGGTAGAFTEMALALYQRQATLLCKSPTVAEVCRKMSIGKTTYYRYWRKVKSAPHRERHTELFEELQAKIEANELSISAACRQMNIGAGTYYRMRDQYKKEHGVPNVPNSE